MPSLASLIARQYKPKVETIPLIKSALKFYRFGAYVTGTFLLLLVVEAIAARHKPGNPLLIAACAIWLTVIVLTVLFLVPINNRMMQLDAKSFPEEAQREHRRWTSLHHLRVTALIMAMICFLLAAHQ